MYKFIFIFFLSILCPQLIYSARILGVFSIPSISHQVVYRALYSELVNRGHELVVVTPDPMYRNKTAPENLTEIDVGYLGETFKSIINRSDPLWKRIIKRGVIVVPKDIFFVNRNLSIQKFAPFLHSTEVSNMIKDKNEKFDLILFEPLSYLPLVLCHIFKAPAIMVTSTIGSPSTFATVGAISRHPILHPHVFRDNYNPHNIFEKIFEVYMEYKYYKVEQNFEKMQNQYLQQQFGSVPPIKELKKYVQLYFVNCHPLFDGNRPVPPGVVYLGAMHLQPIKELPEDLKSYLDNSKRSVIYVSFGTNVETEYMDSGMVNEFLDAFEALPYDILWKFDNDNMDRIPKNVMIQKWFPQRDLLVHPNIKLFITQGGRQSTDEAIDAGVPLVGIPFLTDQWFSVQKYVELGIGVKVDAITLTATDIIEAVNTVLGDESYRNNVRELCKTMKDQKESPIERAVWWTEYVLRHNGSRHLVSPAADITWSEYLMADVAIVIAIISFILCLTALLFFYSLFRFISLVNVNLKIKSD